MIDPPLAQALREISGILTRLGVRYIVVGSLASSAHGVYRATADGDLLADIRPQQSAMLVAALGRAWYADADAIERAIRERQSFNVIHIPTAQKIDVFPVKNEFQEVEMQRAAVLALPPGQDGLRLPVASKEDTVISKLQWFRAGGEVSERQWSDVTTLIAQNPDLDLSYSRLWARRIGVEDLLERALAEAGLKP